MKIFQYRIKNCNMTEQSVHFITHNLLNSASSSLQKKLYLLFKLISFIFSNPVTFHALNPPNFPAPTHYIFTSKIHSILCLKSIQLLPPKPYSIQNKISIASLQYRDLYNFKLVILSALVLFIWLSYNQCPLIASPTNFLSRIKPPNMWGYPS